MSTFGTTTMALRKALGRTQKEFGIIGNLTQSNLSNAENDKTLPNLDFIIHVKEAFPNINLNWWIEGSGEMFLRKEEKKQLPAKMDPQIKQFLETLHEEVSKISETNKLLEIISKKKI